jgi:hypothetical protein|tara:strand:+ start:316 stop:486 length:171 start_codon:yes stop_codon:yes gene_type:complete
MKPFITAMCISILMIVLILFFDPASVFKHGMTCTGAIGGGCDTTTATGGIYKWIGG